MSNPLDQLEKIAKQMEILSSSDDPDEVAIAQLEHDIVTQPNGYVQRLRQELRALKFKAKGFTDIASKLDNHSSQVAGTFIDVIKSEIKIIETALSNTVGIE